MSAPLLSIPSFDHSRERELHAQAHDMAVGCHLRSDACSSRDERACGRPGTGLGHDYTVFATVTGKVKFEHATKDKKRIRVEAVETAPAGATA